MSNMIIRCSKCGSDFMFSDGEQKFYAQKGYNLPKNCPNCRQNKTSHQQNNPRPPVNYGRSVNYNGLAMNAISSLGGLISSYYLSDMLAFATKHTMVRDVTMEIKVLEKMLRNDNISEYNATNRVVDILRKSSR